MSLHGIIDLGSNSVRLVVYAAPHATRPGNAIIADDRPGRDDDRLEQSGNVHNRGDACDDDACDDGAAETSGAISCVLPFRRRFRALIDEKKIAGLASYVEGGRFTSAGIARATEVLDDHLRHAHNIGCDDVHIFATAVLRNCVNSEEARKAIMQGIDHGIDVLSSDEEAHLGFIGATYAHELRQGTLMDIGGGSTELTAIQDAKETCSISIPLGSVSSYAAYVACLFPTEAEMRAIQEAVLCRLDKMRDRSFFRAETFFAIGGAARAAAKMYAVCSSDAATTGTPRVLSRHDIDAVIDLYRHEPNTFSHLAARAVPERLHTLIPGCIISATLMAAFDARKLEICRGGLREGYLIERILRLSTPIPESDLP